VPRTPALAPAPNPRGTRETVAVFSGGGTGGHLYPALALALGLQRLRPEVRPFFVGAQRGLEARILPERGVEHLLLPVRGFHRGVLLQNLGVLAGLLRSLFLVGEAFLRLRPGMVVVTGGFAGGPAGIMAGLMGIPLALQEQNAQPGVTTRALSRWSRQIHLAFPEAKDLLPRGARPRARISGNPIRTPPRTDPGKARAHFGLKPEGDVVLVVGGSQGSEALNRSLLDMVRRMVSGDLRRPDDLQILWGTGASHLDGIHGELETLGDPAWVRPLGYFHEIPLALDAATVAVSRSGAMTTSELLAWGLPAVLVPLPTAAADHQARNAESLARAGAAVHLPEARLSAASLWEAVESILSEPGRLEAMGKAAIRRSNPDATMVIARDLATLLPGRDGGNS
jgi:UDP-N-acetylglucosamine--N-acetylmuramyl-(pentapeptide) pyrophosphoryl-undecaprenol N-acetylglucosamine transferase